MDEKLPKMWVQGFFFFFFSCTQQDLSWKDVSLINFVLACVKGKKSSSFTPGSSQTSLSEVNTYLAVPVNQAFTYQLSIDNLF